MHSSSGRRRGLSAAIVATTALVVGMIGLAGPASAAPTHSLTVTVTGTDPGGVADITIEVYGSGQDLYKQTDANGRAVFPGLTEGDTFSIYVDDNRTNPAYNDSGSTSVTIGTSDTSAAPIALTNHVRCSGSSSAAGSFVVGSPLTAQGTTPTGEAATATYYYWQRLIITATGVDSTTVQGGPSATYTPTASDVGHQLIVYTYYRSANGTGYCGDYKATPVINPPGTPVSAPPAVTGKGKVGKRLSANAGPVVAGTTLSYQWYRTAKVKKGSKIVLKAIKGATGSSYKLKKADKGKKVSVAVTYTRPGYAPTTALSSGKKVK